MIRYIDKVVQKHISLLLLVERLRYCALIGLISYILLSNCSGYSLCIHTLFNFISPIQKICTSKNKIGCLHSAYAMHIHTVFFIISDNLN